MEQLNFTWKWFVFLNANFLDITWCKWYDFGREPTSSASGKATSGMSSDERNQVIFPASLLKLASDFFPSHASNLTCIMPIIASRGRCLLEFSCHPLVHCHQAEAVPWKMLNCLHLATLQIVEAVLLLEARDFWLEQEVRTATWAQALMLANHTGKGGQRGKSRLEVFLYRSSLWWIIYLIGFSIQECYIWTVYFLAPLSSYFDGISSRHFIIWVSFLHWKVYCMSSC